MGRTRSLRNIFQESPPTLIAGLMRGEGSDIPRNCIMLERERHAKVRRADVGYPVRGIRTADHLYLLQS